MLKTCKVKMLRRLVEQRLTSAAEEILDLFERTIAEYEEELCRSRKENERKQNPLDAVWNPEVLFHTADSLPPPEQQDRIPNVDQEDPEPPHIKEEQDEVWIDQEGEQLQGQDEAGVTKFPSTPVTVKTEDDEEKPQPSELHQRQPEGNGEGCGGSEAVSSFDPDQYLQPIKDDQPEDSSDTEDSAEDWTLSSEAESDFNKKTKPPASISTEHMETEAGGEDCGGSEPDINPGKSRAHFSKSKCRRSRSSPKTNTAHRTKVSETPGDKNSKDFAVRDGGKIKPHLCTECGKTFEGRSHLEIHMRVHTGEKPFCCWVCGKRFAVKSTLLCHMRVHTGEKPFSCSVCKQSFKCKSHVRRHMVTHTGEKQFDCSVCGTRFTQKSNLLRHMGSHTEEKHFSCSVCKKRFAQKGYVRKHMRIHAREKTPGPCVAAAPDSGPNVEPESV